MNWYTGQNSTYSPTKTFRNTTMNDSQETLMELGSQKKKKNVGCMDCFARSLLVLFNVIFITGGFVLISLAIWTAVNPSSLYTALKGLNPAVSDVTQGTLDGLVLGVSGCMLAVPGLTGCCGALLGWPSLLYMYSTVVSISLLTQVGSGIGLVMYKNETETFARQWLSKNIKQDYSVTSSDKSTAIVWDRVFLTFECCGSDNYTDFEGSNYSQETGATYPISCCKQNTLSKNPKGDITCLPQETGCFGKIMQVLKMLRVPIFASLLTFSSIELLAIILAMYLARSNRYT